MSRYERRKLTEGFINGLPVDGRTTYQVRDTKVTGLLVAVNKLSKTYKVQRDLWRGDHRRRKLIKTVRVAIGTTDQLTLEAARLKAQDIIKQIILGNDPNERQSKPRTECWTVYTLIEEYVADLQKRDCAPGTIKYARELLDRYLVDWKDKPLSQLTRSMVRAKHQHITEKNRKVVANQTMRLIRAAYNLALRIIDDPDMLPDHKPLDSNIFSRKWRSRQGSNLRHPA